MMDVKKIIKLFEDLDKRTIYRKVANHHQGKFYGQGRRQFELPFPADRLTIQ